MVRNLLGKQVVTGGRPYFFRFRSLFHLFHFSFSLSNLYTGVKIQFGKKNCLQLALSKMKYLNLQRKRQYSCVKIKTSERNSMNEIEQKNNLRDVSAFLNAFSF